MLHALLICYTNLKYLKSENGMLLGGFELVRPENDKLLKIILGQVNVPL